MYFVRSDWANAHRFLERSFKDKDCSLVNFLAAAYAACETGQHDTWENHLTQAARKYPESLSIVNTVRADLLMRVGHLEQSLAVLEQVRKKSDKDRQLLVLLKEAYLQLKDWQRLENLMPALKKAEAVNDEEFLQLQKLLFEADLHRQIEQLSSQEQISDDDRQNLMKSWNKAPHKYHDDPEVVEDFVRRLTGIGANQEAAQVIEAALGKFWNDRLVEIYGELDSVDYTFQLTQAEEWLQQNPNNAGLLLTLGRISLRNEQRDKANDYLQKSIDIEPSAAAYDELNRLKALQ